MAKLPTKPGKSMPKAEFGLPAQKPASPAKANKAPDVGRGNGPGGEVRHPQSHAEFEKLGR